MAFNFQAYRNPYVSTIADLLSRGEDAKAKALVDVANAQARAAEARGQAFGGAAESVGKIASKALTDYTTAKQNAPIRAAEAELRQQALETGRDARLLQKGQAFLSSAMADAPDPNYERDAATGMSRYAGPPSPTYPGLYKPGPLGSKLLDPTAARQLLVDNGFAGNVEALMPIVTNQNARTSAMVAGKLKARGEYAEDALQMMQAGAPWEQAVGFAGHSGVENGLFSEKELSDLTASGVNLPPEQQKAILLNVMKQGGAPTTFEAPGQNQFVGGIATGVNTGAKPLTDAEQLSAAYAAKSPTPEQQALITGDAARATNLRAPVAPPKLGSIEDRVRQGLALETQKLGRPLTAQETFNITTAISKPPPAASSGASQGQAMIAGRLSDDFNRDSKDYLSRLGSYTTIRDVSAPGKDSAAGDIVLIFAFMKMVDPTSTVRESEQASAQNTAGVEQRVRNIYNKALTGERLSPEQRADFANQTETIFRNAQQRQRGILQVYGDRAKRAGLDPRDAVIDFDVVYGVPPPVTQAQPIPRPSRTQP